MSRERVFSPFFGNGSKSSNMLGKSDNGVNAFRGSAETPQYMIKSENIFDSDVSEDKYKYMEQAAPCLNVELGYIRNNTNDSSGENTQDGRLIARTTLVCMRIGQWGPKLQERMFKASKIDQIEIHRVKSVEGTLTAIQIVTYKKCLITEYEQDSDTITFAFSFAVVNDTVNMYNSNHEALGVISSEYDFEAAFYGSE